MKVFYNEWDKYTADWLRQLIYDGALPNGVVSEKSICDLSGEDLDGYHQCHFFAGIGGWPLAFKLASVENIPNIWSGSPPCQPFSVVGKRKGMNDDRHLSPTWVGLIREKKPSAIFGEQVASAISHGWVDELRALLEREGYAFGFSVLSGHVVSAPHERKRIMFGAIKVADSGKVYGSWFEQGCIRQQEGNESKEYQARSSNSFIRSGFWSDYEIQTSEYDGKNRICKPGVPLLVNGIPGTVGGIAGYGNAIIPQVASIFITQFMEAVGDMINE